MASQITQFFCILVRRNAPELRQIVILPFSVGLCISFLSGSFSLSFCPGTRQLFGYAEIEDEGRWAAIAQTEVRATADALPAAASSKAVALCLSRCHAAAARF